MFSDRADQTFQGGLNKALQNYFKVSSNDKPSRMKVASSIQAKHSTNINELLDENDRLNGEYKKKYTRSSWNDLAKIDYSFTDLKIEIAEKIMDCCVLCEKNCEINRNFEKGFCSVQKPYIASEFLHMGEEPPLIPSHTIFFAGCNFECVYCQNHDISQNPEVGMLLEPEKLAKIIDLRRKQGSRNVNFVGGDPTPNLPYILKTMKHTLENIPVVWNSNLYLSEYSMQLLDGFVDLYLTDFKYGCNECAQRLSGISNYTEVVRRNHILAYNAGDMIIRHLILPNHVECCSKPLLKWIRNNLGKDVVLNIMAQYHPVYKASEHDDLSRLVNSDELREVMAYAESLGFNNLI